MVKTSLWLLANGNTLRVENLACGFEIRMEILYGQALTMKASCIFIDFIVFALIQIPAFIMELYNQNSLSNRHNNLFSY